MYFLTSIALSLYKSQNILGWSKFFVPDQKFICILWQSQTFCVGQNTKVFEEGLNEFKFLGLLKKFGPAQNILKHLKGQGNCLKNKVWIWNLNFLTCSPYCNVPKSFQKTSHLNHHTHLLFFLYNPYHNGLQKLFHPFVLPSLYPMHNVLYNLECKKRHLSWDLACCSVRAVLPSAWWLLVFWSNKAKKL